ncbi:putative transposase for IS1106A3 [Neisseria meningitidis 63049]|nr:putative transposase for IS1106A3 [Neisseria meningitidis 63049]VEJ37278.1 IS1106 transposase [Neisseria meningitidis]
MPLPQPATQDDTLSELPELINRQLTEKNLKIEKASAAVVDATIIQTETFAKFLSLPTAETQTQVFSCFQLFSAVFAPNTA